MTMTAANDDDDDDLAAFFDDVENAVQGAEHEKDEVADSNEQDQRPSKRAKSEATTGSAFFGAEGDHRATEVPLISNTKQPVKVVAASSVPVRSLLPSYHHPSVAETTVPRGTTSTTTVVTSAMSNIPQPQQLQSTQTILSTIPPNQLILPPTLLPGDRDGQYPQQQQQQQPPPPPQQNDVRPHIRSAAGETWVDPTLTQWPSNDFRLFIGNLAKDLKQSHLENAFSKYPSFHMARVMYEKTTGKSRGYGFVSLLDPKDCARAIREMDQSWLGSRPIKVKLSEWKDREWKEVVKKNKKQKFGKR